MLAATGPSAGTQGVLYGIALVLFIIGAILAWITPPALHRAVASIAVGLAVWVLVLAWIAFASA